MALADPVVSTQVVTKVRGSRNLARVLKEINQRKKIVFGHGTPALGYKVTKRPRQTEKNIRDYVGLLEYFNLVGNESVWNKFMKGTP